MGAMKQSYSKRQETLNIQSMAGPQMFGEEIDSCREIQEQIG